MIHQNKIYPMRKNYLLALLLLTVKLIAQNPEIDHTFNTKDDGIYHQIIGSRAVVLSNNKILSVFERYYDYNVMLLNPDGSPDKTFNTANSFSENEIRIFANSSGAFLTLDYDNKLKAFNADGTLNPRFPVTIFGMVSSTPVQIKNIIYQDDGKVIIHGVFETVNDVYTGGCVRLNLDGTIDDTFKLQSGGYKLIIQSDGKYVILGSATTISRYLENGKIDPTFKVIATVDPKLNFVTNGFETENNSSIDDIIVQPDGKIIAVGCNYKENGRTVAYQIVRLNADGTRDTSFKSLDSRTDRVVKVYLQKDNKIIINVGNSTFTRLNTDGSIDATFKYSNTVSLLNKGTLFFQEDKMIINADYKDSMGMTRTEIHRINSDGSLDLSFNPSSGPNLLFDQWDERYAYPFAAKVLLDQKILLAGDFTTYNDNIVQNVCRINQNGEYDSSFKLDPNVKINALSSQNDYLIISQPDGKILLMHNNAITANGISKSLIRLNSDGSLDKSFNFEDYSSRITDVKLLENGKFLVMGRSGIFVKNGTNYGTTINTVLQLNPNGSIDNNFNGVFNQIPVGIFPLSDKKFLISFYRENTVYDYDAVIKFNEDGSKDSSFKVGFQPFYNVKELSDGKLLALVDQKITRINTNGSVDTSFTPYSIAKTYSNTYDRFDFYQNGEINVFYSTYETDSTTKLTLSEEGKLLNTTIYKSGSQFEIQNCEDIIFYGSFDTVDKNTKHNIFRYKSSNSTSTPNPAGEIFQPFTYGQTLADLTIAGADLKWYTQQSSCGINSKLTNKGKSEDVLPSSTLLVNGTTYYASQTINNTESSYRLPVTVYSATLGVKENQLPSLITYPNPVKGIYSISNNENITKIEIYNLLGQLISSNIYDKKNLEIDFTTLTSGLYFAKIYVEDKSAIIKIIKN